MKNHTTIALSAMLAVGFALPAKPNPKPAAKPAAQTQAQMDADIDKLMAERRKRFDLIYPQSQQDLSAGNFADAEKKLLECIQITDAMSDGEPKLQSLTALGNVYLKQKKYREAEKYFKESYDTNNDLYRGNFPELIDAAGGLSEVYKSAGKTKEATAIVAQAKEIRATRYSVAGVDKADLFAAYYEQLRAAVSKNDPAAAAKLFKYPVSVRWNPDKGKAVTRTYKTAQELQSNFKSIFTPAVTKLIAATPEKQLWCKDEGIMLGAGLLWLTDVPLMSVGGKQTYTVQSMTVNANPPAK
ncbi:MAG: tetratricopeptide repeat protein [Candidatus Obscuribacterales bacterium]